MREHEALATGSTQPLAPVPRRRADAATAGSAAWPRPRAAIRVARRFSAPAERVFDAWLDPARAGQWLFATALRPMARVAIDARVGGAFRFAERRDGEDIEHSGEYLEIDRPRRLVFTLSTLDQAGAVTCATVEIAPLASGCRLCLTHEGLPVDCARRMENRWTGILYGLGIQLGSNRRGGGK